jgi:hypothetical protein
MRTGGPVTPHRRVPLWWRAARCVLLAAGGFALLLTGCQSRLIYFPSPYHGSEIESFGKRGGLRLDYTTGEGRQSAWLIPPRDGKPVDRFWIVCGGNAARALDYEMLCRDLPFAGDAFLLFDYPGYGACEGSSHPSRIRESLRTVIPLAAEKLNLATGELSARGCVLGQSLGAAAALMAVEEFKLRRAVLCSPFTSTMDMTRVMFRVPLGFLVRHRFDNRAGLAALQKYGGRAWLLHGTDDTIIPAEMSRTLAREFPATVTLTEVSGADHNDLLDSAMPQITGMMAAARRE